MKLKSEVRRFGISALSSLLELFAQLLRQEAGDLLRVLSDFDSGLLKRSNFG